MSEEIYVNNNHLWSIYPILLQKKYHFYFSWKSYILVKYLSSVNIALACKYFTVFTAQVWTLSFLGTFSNDTPGKYLPMLGRVSSIYRVGLLRTILPEYLADNFIMHNFIFGFHTHSAECRKKNGFLARKKSWQSAQIILKM